MTRPPRTTFLGIALPEIGDAEVEEIIDTLRSGWLTSGPKVRAFQDDVARYVGVPHVRCLTSCTAGLQLALVLTGIERGDEVLVPANTFVSCANAIEHVGGRPVFVDAEPGTGLLDLRHAESLIGPRTRALIAVHVGGRPVDLDALARLRERHGIEIIEDAAHALGAEWRGRRVGAWGNLCSFSFHATKNITTFEGGAFVVRDELEAERVERLSLHGLTRSAWRRHGTGAPDRYDVVEPGYKFGMHDVSAAVGLHQLRRLDGWIERRERIAQLYDAALAGLPLELAPAVPEHVRHARHLYMVRVPEEARLSRDDLIVALRGAQIGSSVHFRGIHLQTYYAETYGIRPEDLPVATDWADRALTLPLHPAMTEDDVADVAAALDRALSSGRVAA